MFPPGFVLPVISTDKDITLGNAIASVLPGTVHILCVWNIEKNMLMEAKWHFATQEEADTLLAGWQRLCASGDDTAYRRNLTQLQQLLLDHELVLAYLTNT
ncbi:hypothetical protein PsorP6_005361 [Peronosclerospora sorghi]|uniref:Uncharacterized protein n=1 Tax=Peronosclerospora sorghi TaxID=230839 RepID=A0ACC0W193_9STRA|nr:hypothetical protein PsorP6_005361 [Peronosclerospora sorghi]